jgi:signal peptidase I
MRRGLLVVAGLLLFLVGTGIVLRISGLVAMRAYRISSSSMESTLHCARPSPGCEAGTSDGVLVLRRAPSWTPSRGDIVAFETPPATKRTCGAGGTFIFRIIGLPGERVQIKLRQGAAHVFIDGKHLEEPYIEEGRRGTGLAESFTVPAGEYFVMGDNRGQSCDSRAWGPVPRENIIGPVAAIYWPFDRLGST